MDEKKLLQLVNDQYQESYSATIQKRQRMRDRLKYFMNTNKNDDKVSLYMIRGYVNTLISLYYEDGLSQKFYSRDIYSFMEADNLNTVAEADHALMKMDVKDYFIQRNRLVYGVGIRVFTGWDAELKCPIFETIHPLDIYPDARGYGEINNFKYFGFERSSSIQELHDMGYENLDQVQAYLSNEQEINLQYLGENKELYPQLDMVKVSDEMKKEFKDNSTTTVYYHYLTVDGEAHQVVVWNKTLILSDKVIDPLANDKYAKKIMKFPIALNYYEPFAGDPRGNSLFDVLEDKQKTKTLFVNLMRIKAMKEALGGQMFIDREVFMDNKTQLSKPTVGRQYIPVRSSNGPIGNSVFSVPDTPISPDVYNLRNILDQEAESDSGVGNAVKGMPTGGNQTATEVKNTQMNSNVNLVLGNKINGRGERDFWTCWFYRYKFYFKVGDEKQITSKRGLMNIGKIFKKKDLMSSVDPSLEILNKGMQETKRKVEADKFLNLFRGWMQQPDVAPVSRRFLQRKAMRLQGMSVQEIEVAVPYSPEEMDAKNHVLLLNRNIPIKVGSMNEDHYTYIVIYTAAMDTPAKFSAIEARKQAYIESGQSSSDTAATKNNPGGGTGGIANQMISQEIGQQAQGVPNSSQM